MCQFYDEKIQSLQDEIKSLKGQLQMVKAKFDGLNAEVKISNYLPKSRVTPFHEVNGDIVSHDNKIIEVKYSNNHGTTSSPNFHWHKIYGRGYSKNKPKEYDFLLLVGQLTQTETINFLIPKDDIPEDLVGKRGQIQIRCSGQTLSSYIEYLVPYKVENMDDLPSLISGK